MIEFLQDYTTEALPPETFTKGQKVERTEASEDYFVRRGLAGYVVDGKLVDVDHQPIATAFTAIEVVQPGDNRLGLGLRAGEVMTGRPPRASSGPGVPFVEPAAGTAGLPSVVLEAEIERLKAELLAATGEGDDLAQSLATAHGDLHLERVGHGTTRDELSRATQALADAERDRDAARSALATAEDRAADLEAKLAAAAKPAPTESQPDQSSGGEGGESQPPAPGKKTK